MSDRQWTDPDRPFRMVTRVTADYQIPLYEDSFKHGAYRMQPIPPADPMFEDWEELDLSDDRWTTWFRRCDDHIVTARLGGSVGSLTARSRKVAHPRRRQYRPPAGS